MKILIPVLLLAFAACVSPEATRTRGAPGADQSNRGKILRMHEGARPFENTPKKIPTKHPPLDGANHADQLARQ